MSATRTLDRAAYSIALALLLSLPAWFSIRLLAAEPDVVTDLVTAAQQAELSGQTQQRAEYLQRALALDSDDASARWLAGYVQFDGQWRKIEEVADATQSNASLAEYEQRRDAMRDTVAAHAAMARWCHRKRLGEQERAHWMRVLRLDPENADAQGALKLRSFGGQLMTPEQVAQAKEWLRQTRKNYDQWKRILGRHLSNLASGDPKSRAKAREQIERTTDPAALRTLEILCAEQTNSSARKDEARQAFGMATVAAVGRMPQQSATESLVRLAVYSPDVPVRRAAIKQLKSRPLVSYVPLLLDGLEMQLEARVRDLSKISPDNFYRYEIVQQQRDMEVELKLDYGVVFGQEGNRILEGDVPPGYVRSREAYLDFCRWRQLTPVIRQDVAQIEAVNARIDATNRRICRALSRATDVKFPKDTGFGDRQESGPPEPANDTWESAGNELFAPDLVQDDLAVEQYDPMRWWDWWDQYTARYKSKDRPTISYHSQYVQLFASCFAAGTMVSTQLGPRPIESLRLGDLVLSQDVDSGQLEFQPVLETTRRQEADTVRIELGTSSLVTTPGHPFWVVGQGWRVAKNLHDGDRLHGLEGSTAITRIGAGATQDVFNLIVARHNTYFAGPKRLLVHDVTPHGPSRTLLPGYLPRRIESHSQVGDPPP